MSSASVPTLKSSVPPNLSILYGVPAFFPRQVSTNTPLTKLFTHALTLSTVGIRLRRKTWRIWNRTLDVPTLEHSYLFSRMFRCLRLLPRLILDRSPSLCCNIPYSVHQIFESRDGTSCKTNAELALPPKPAQNRHQKNGRTAPDV